jgi:hypothetical protein
MSCQESLGGNRAMDKTVKIVKIEGDKEVAGSMGFMEEPQVGDVGKIIYEYPDPDNRVTVEKSDPEGNTIWFADFHPDELEYLQEGAEE